MAIVPRAIHQFHGSTSVGDAITNGLLFTRDLLRTLGFVSEIYCVDIAPELAGEIRPAPSFPDSPDTVLLVHFSWAIKFDGWLQRLQCRKALIYHNITPDEFFNDGDWFEQTARLSRRQLAALQPSMGAALAQSAFSARELQKLGFANVDVLPLLFDPGAWRDRPCDAEYLRVLEADDTFKILFVGRIVRNKCQSDLLRVADWLRRMTGRPIRLTLAGGLGADAAYRDGLLALCEELGLQACIEFAGKVDDRRLRALYRGSDVFLCLSEHEGFCVPIVEAMQYDLPVVAYAASAVPETMGDGGLLLDDKDPGRVAAALKVLSEEPELRRRLVRAGRRNVLRFSRARSLHGLARFLRDRLDIQILVPATPPEPTVTDQPARWRVEGPFDSSYSLALVNRSLARALEKQGADIGLHSTEGDGDFTPAASFLKATPTIAALWQRAREMDRPDIVLRNLYPPRVSGMIGTTRVLGNWGWEESGLPTSWTDRFNNTLSLITPVSRFVAKVLRDNGVRVPIAVVGNGCEHFQGVRGWEPPMSLGSGRFRYLHVSSGFPRKGVDSLLEAWGLAFTRTDDVTLILKTFPNPHNDVATQVAALAVRYPDHAEIVLIEAEISAEEMSGLYQACQAIVAPSRGEGFGLPVAEAMLHELPVIATGHGGMLDFCSSETAWLVDYRFAYADTHFGLFNSVWADPLVDDLVRALREVRSTPVEQRQARTRIARSLIESTYTWSAVAERTQEAVAALDRHLAPSPLPKVAWVTTWNIRCGIASYARYLASAVPAGNLVVLASRSGDLLQVDEPFVRRCWTQGWEDDLAELYRAIRGSGATKAVIQFNFGFFEIMAFGRLLDRLKADGVSCELMLHSTLDVNRPGLYISLRQIRRSLENATRLMVHSVADLNTLKSFGLVDNVALFPHGLSAQPSTDPEAARQELGLEGRKVIATFGYLLPNKGLVPLIEAFALLRGAQPNLHLLMLNAMYPVPESHQEAEMCRQAIARHGLGEAITLVTEYLPEERAHALLQAADLIVYAYQHTQESASGAVRFGIASGRPVACTPLPIFDDVDRVVHRLPGLAPVDLARGIEELIVNTDRLEAKAQAQSAYIDAHDWPTLSMRLWNMLRAPPVIDLVARGHLGDQMAAMPGRAK